MGERDVWSGLLVGAVGRGCWSGLLVGAVPGPAGWLRESCSRLQQSKEEAAGPAQLSLCAEVGPV